MKAAFLIAAPHSGSGKTTLARGLMALLRRQGWRVQPFKCGPDYIDTKFHEAVCGRPSVNLDTFMAPEDHVRELFRRYTLGAGDAPAWAREAADVAVVEGMMGLFDGYERDRGSSAEVACVLGLPVVLVVDARSAAYSTAALLQGFMHFRPGLRLAGVIYNKVGSRRHAQLLTEVAAEAGLPCLGCIPRQAGLEQGSRYLGLDFSAPARDEELLRTLEQHIDLPALMQLTAGVPASAAAGTSSPCRRPHGTMPPAPPVPGSRHILVARNAESFSFLYQESLDALAELGPLTFFDPEGGQLPALLAGAGAGSLLYLPGGYPEKHLQALVAAEATRRSVRDFAAAGGHIVAECGGMMYLCRSILTDDGEFPMCGVLPCSVGIRRPDRRLSLGYRRFCLDGRELRGHEFHYSQFLPPPPASCAQVFDARGRAVDTAVVRQDHVLASYTHLSPQSLRLVAGAPE